MIDLAYKNKPTYVHSLIAGFPEVARLAPRLRIYDKDESIACHGDTAKWLWLLCRGWVKLSRNTPDGQQTIISLCTQGDIFGEAALFPHANYPYDITALSGDTEVAVIAAEDIRRLVKENDKLSNHLMYLLNERVSEARLKLEHLNVMSAAQRLGCFLLNLCKEHVGDEMLIDIPLEKHILASYLGMKPETLSRSQQQIKAIGIGVTGSSIRISSIRRLREFVCNSCSASGNCEAED